MQPSLRKFALTSTVTIVLLITVFALYLQYAGTIARQSPIESSTSQTAIPCTQYATVLPEKIVDNFVYWNNSDYYVEVNYTGNWSAQLMAYPNGMGVNSTAIVCLSSHGNGVAGIPNPNVQGETMVCASVHKLDSSTAVLAVSESYGTIGYLGPSNSTASAYGMTQVCDTVAP